MASVEQHGPSWRVIWRYKAEKQRCTWPTQDLADEARGIVEARRHQMTETELYAAMGVSVTAPEPAAPPLREWCKTWLKSKTRLTPGTLAAYRRQFETRIYPVLGDEPMDRITPTQIGTLLNNLRDPEDEDEPGLKNTTVTRYYTLLHSAWEAAIWDRVPGVTDNVVARTDWERDRTEHDDTGESDQVRLTPAEYKLLLAGFEPDDRPLVELLAATGCRWSEATALSVGHVNRTDAMKPKVRIWRAWKRDGKGGWYLGTTKGRRRRELGVRLGLIPTLKPLLDDRADGEFLFTAPGGGSVHYSNFLQRRWNPALARAMRCGEHPPADRGGQRDEPGRRRCRDFGGTNDQGRPCGAITAGGRTRCHSHMGPAPDAVSACACPGVLRRRPTPHDLRHTHAAWLFSDPRSTPLGISRRLGHAQLSTTSEIYGDLMPDAEDGLIDALDDVLS